MKRGREPREGDAAGAQRCVLRVLLDVQACFQADQKLWPEARVGENCPEERAKEESNEERPEVRPERRRPLCSLTLGRSSLWPWRAALASAERSYSCTSVVSDEIESGRASAASDAIDSGRASAELERLRDATETAEPRTAVVELAECERLRCCTATPGAGGGGGILLAVLPARRAAAEAVGIKLNNPFHIPSLFPSVALCRLVFEAHCTLILSTS